MNILIITPNTIDTTSYYRAWGVFPSLVRQMGTHVNLLTDKGKSMTWVDISQMDLIFMHRPYTMEHYNFARYAKEMNVPVWVDFDDDLTSIPEWMTFHQTFMTEPTQKIIKAITGLADWVSVSTFALAERLQEYNSIISVIPNAINDDLFKSFGPYSENKIVMWRGSETHHMDLMTYADAIKDSMTKETWEWVYFGFNPWFLPKTTHIPTTDPVMYFRAIRGLAPSVMFVPLIDDTFNRCKSNINWLEATMAGSVLLAPKWEVWDKPGVFKYDDQESFTYGLQHLTSGDSIFQRKKAYQDSVEYIRETLMLSIVNKQRMDIIDTLLK